MGVTSDTPETLAYIKLLPALETSFGADSIRCDLLEGTSEYVVWLTGKIDDFTVASYACINDDGGVFPPNRPTLWHSNFSVGI
jgi:hypothetical protein